MLPCICGCPFFGHNVAAALFFALPLLVLLLSFRGEAEESAVASSLGSAITRQKTTANLSSPQTG
jgi:hypothetical protein